LTQINANFCTDAIMRLIDSLCAIPATPAGRPAGAPMAQ